MWSGASLVWQGSLSLIVVCGGWRAALCGCRAIPGHLPTRAGLTRSVPHIFMRHTHCQSRLPGTPRKSATLKKVPHNAPVLNLRVPTATIGNIGIETSLSGLY